MMSLKTETRSPLRYAGGKSRGVKEITKYIPENTKEICSPFFGGGSVRLLVQIMIFEFMVLTILNH